MSTTAAIVILWAIFTLTHLGLASVRVEPRLRKRLGSVGFLGLYSLISFASFVPLCWIYFGSRHTGPWLWQLTIGPELRALLYCAMALATAILVYGALRPSPASIAAGEFTGEIRGAFRITRSPLLVCRAWTMSPRCHRCRSQASCSAVSYRSSGRFSRHLWTIASKSRGTRGSNLLIGSTSVS